MWRHKNFGLRFGREVILVIFVYGYIMLYVGSRRTRVNPTDSVAVTSVRPTEGNEPSVSLYDDLQSTTYARPISMDIAHSNPGFTSLASLSPPSVYDRIIDRQIPAYVNMHLPINTNDVQLTSFADLGTRHVSPSSVERPLSNPESSVIAAPLVSEHDGLPETTGDSPQLTSYTGMNTEMPYSRLDASDMEPPQPPAVYERMATRTYSEVLAASDSASEYDDDHSAEDDNDDYDDVGHN